MSSAIDLFGLKGKVAVITGGGGILGLKHAEAIIEAGGLPVAWDINEKAAQENILRLKKSHGFSAVAMCVDITNRESISQGLKKVLDLGFGVHILINNAATDPKVEDSKRTSSRLETYPVDWWNKELAVGLTGAFLCSQVVGSYMSENGGGVILNIASDLSIIAPDQRLYWKESVPEGEQSVKSVSYSVVKHGIVGLTRYLATYWNKQGVRANAISPGGIYNEGLPSEFVRKLERLIPLGRMATKDEYKAAVIFLCSDASAYMTGHNLVMDGGRSVW